MTSHAIIFALFASGSLLARPAAATGPKPAQRAPAARPATPAAHVATTPKPEAAPHTVCLSGTIVGADGRPRPGACVFPIANRRLIAVADAAGTFRLQLPAGAGPIQVQADYFGMGSRRIEVDGEHPQPVSIVLGQ